MGLTVDAEVEHGFDAVLALGGEDHVPILPRGSRTEVRGASLESLLEAPRGGGRKQFSQRQPIQIAGEAGIAVIDQDRHPRFT